MKIKQLAIPFVLTLVLSYIFLDLAHANIVKIWTPKSLNHTAQSVYIVTVSKIAPSGRDLNLAPRGIKGKLVGHNATCKVEFVFKGIVEDNIQIHYYKLETDDHFLVDGPTLISFRTKPTTIKHKDTSIILGAPKYLVHLKYDNDLKAFVPISDYYNQQDSVFELIPAELPE